MSEKNGDGYIVSGALPMKQHISILVDDHDIVLFAETPEGNDALRLFATAAGWKWDIGHGSTELRTYKDFTCVFLKRDEVAPR
jgi:hypothetical protein